MGVHLPSHHHRRAVAEPPRGCIAIRVSGPGDEPPEKFVVPVAFLKHPLFLALLKEAEEEFGFEQPGAITIPCGVEQFRRVRGIIEGDVVHSAHGHGHGHGHHLHFRPLVGCFRA